ncbi:MAG: hypothetical protein WAW52_12630 [Methanothrix sp.]
MSKERQTPAERRPSLQEKIGQAADEIKRIDNRLSSLLEGRKGQGGAEAA